MNRLITKQKNQDVRIRHTKMPAFQKSEVFIGPPCTLTSTSHQKSENLYPSRFLLKNKKKRLNKLTRLKNAFCPPYRELGKKVIC